MDDIKVELRESLAMGGPPDPMVEKGPTTEPVEAQGMTGVPITAETPPPCDMCKGKQKLECPLCKDKPNPKCPACAGTKEVKCPACTESEVQQPTLVVQFKDPMAIQFSIEAVGFHPALVNLQMLAVAEFLKARVMHILEKQFDAQDEENKVKAGIQEQLLRGVKPGMRLPPRR